MKAKTTKSKAPAKAAKVGNTSKMAAKKSSAKAPAKAVKPAKATKPVRPKSAAKPPKSPKPAKLSPVAKAAAPAKGGRATKTAVAVRPAKPAAARPPIPRPQLIAQRRKEFSGARELLLARQREQTQTYAASKQDSESNLDNGTEDYIDYAVNSYAREFLLSLTEMERKQLLQIEEALRRIDAGEYGRCQQCGQEIPRKRLDIQPWARHCVICQDLEEKGLLPKGGFHAGDDDDAEEDREVVVEEDLDAEPEVEEAEEEEPVIDDEPLVVDAEDAEE